MKEVINMNEHLLQTIDSIDDIIEESEMNVCAALYDEYQKMSILLEYADEDVCEEMTIFQEAAAKNEKSDDKGSSKKENFVVAGLKKLGGIIRTIFTAIVDKIKQIGSKIKSKAITIPRQFINNLRGTDEKENKACNDILRELDRISSIIPKIETTDDIDKNMFKDFDGILKSIDSVENDFKEFSKTSKSIDQEVTDKKKKIENNISQLRKSINDIKKAFNEYQAYDKEARSARLNIKAMNHAKNEIAQSIKRTESILEDLSREFENLSKGVNEVDANELAKFLQVYILYTFYETLLREHRADITEAARKNHIDISWLEATTKEFKNLRDVFETKEGKKVDTNTTAGSKIDRISDRSFLTIKDIDIKSDKLGKLTVKVEKHGDSYVISDISFQHAWNMIPVYIMNHFDIGKGSAWASSDKNQIIDLLNINIDDIVKECNFKGHGKLSDMFSDVLTKSLKISSMKMFDFNNEFVDNIHQNGKLNGEDKQYVLDRYAAYMNRCLSILHIAQYFYSTMGTAIASVRNNIYFHNMRNN